MKFIEWCGFIICLGSMIANGIIRHNGLSNTPWEHFTFILMFAGAVIAIIAFVIRKFGDE
ncbi:hypothetical protein ACA29_15940 [Lederbergia galactosidilytica]|uniref:Uncharacterized protein n=1 Tax=Lederbergia galactosidilytica TaxID=217031 RepID=A0A0Q9XTV0_9BACI|nr:hypothetical protein ACA29_15940 [Lederbergia galactosidilytica]